MLHPFGHHHGRPLGTKSSAPSPLTFAMRSVSPFPGSLPFVGNGSPTWNWGLHTVIWYFDPDNSTHVIQNLPPLPPSWLHSWPPSWSQKPLPYCMVHDPYDSETPPLTAMLATILVPEAPALLHGL